MNGGTLDKTSIAGYYGYKLDKELIPTKSGYRFIGWYYNDTLVKFPYTMQEDITLTAMYELIDSTTDIFNDQVVFKVNGNKVEIYIQNYTQSLITTGTINFDFGQNVKIVRFNNSSSFNVSFSDDYIIFVNKSGISNSYIYLGEIEIERLELVDSISVDVTCEDDIAEFKYESFTINFNISNNDIYFTFEVDNINVNSTYFNVQLYLNNSNNLNIYGLGMYVYIDEGLSISTFTPSAFPYASFNYDITADGYFLETYYRNYSEYTNDSKILVGTFRVFNSFEENGSAKMGLQILQEEYNWIFISNNNVITETLSNVDFNVLTFNVTVPNDSLDSDTSLKLKLNDGDEIEVTGSSYTFEKVSIDTTYVILEAIVKSSSNVKIGSQSYLTGGFKKTLTLSPNSDNKFIITVMAENGDTKEYTIYIPRDGVTQNNNAKLEIRLKDNSKNYDNYFDGLIGFDLYLNEAYYDIYSVTIYLNYDTNKFILSNDKIINPNNGTLKFYNEYFFVKFDNPVYSDELYLGTIYFSLKSTDINGKYTFDFNSEDDISSVYTPNSNVDTTLLFVGEELDIKEGFIPVIETITIYKHGTSVKLYNSSNIVLEDGVIIVPTLAYEYNDIDIYLFATDGTTIKVNNTNYNSYYHLEFNEFSKDLDVSLSVTGSYTTRDYIIKLTRDNGSSITTIDVSVNINDTLTNIVFDSKNEGNISNIRYTYRNNVVVNVTKNNEYQTILIDDLDILTNTYDLSVGNNVITISVTSQNGINAIYKLTLSLDDKVNALISSANISELSKTFDNNSITQDDIEISALLYNEILTNYTLNIKFYNSLGDEIDDILDVGTYTVKIYINSTSEYNESSVYSGDITISKLEISNEEVTNSLSFTLEESSYKYTGSLIKPNVNVLYGDISLLLNKDYSLYYGDESTNINVSSNLAYVLISGLGNYSFEYKLYFEITKKSISDSDVIINISDKEYTGTNIEITYDDITGNYGDNINLISNDYDIVNGNYLEVGSYNITLRGKGNFYSSIVLEFEIVSSTITIDNSKFVIADNDIEYSTGEYSVIYNGSAICPIVRLYFNDILVSSINYDIEYKDNKNAGNAKIILNLKNSLKGNDLELNFEILSIDITDDSNISYDNIPNKIYTGLEIEPDFKVYYGKTILILDTDYRLEFKDNINVGSATIVINGINNYSGKYTITFEIEALNISNILSFELEYEVSTYNGRELKPKVSNVFDGTNYLNDDEYDINYEDNINAGTASVTVSLNSDNYIGSKTLKFIINQLDLSDSSIEIEVLENYIYDGQAHKALYKIYLNNGFDKINITDLLDNTNSLDYDYVNAGNKTLVLSPIREGNFIGTCNVKYEIESRDIKEATIDAIPAQEYTGDIVTPNLIIKYNDKNLVINVDYETLGSSKDVGDSYVRVTGIYNFKGFVDVEFKIVKVSDISVVLDDYDFIYSGDYIKPTNYSFYRSGNILELTIDTDYQVNYYNNLNVHYVDGVVSAYASIEFTFIGNYSGTRIINFSINPLDISNGEFEIGDLLEQYNYVIGGVKPMVTLSRNNEVIDNSYYTIEYSDYESIGTANVSITGILNYKGTISGNYEIIKGTILSDDILVDIDSKTYTGDIISLVYSVIINGDIYTSESMYTAYLDEELNNEISIINAGSYYIKFIVDTDNFIGEKVISYSVDKKELVEEFLIEDINISYIGKNVEITNDDINLMYLTNTLTLGNDYTLDYDESMLVGKYDLTITGFGNYCGEITTKYNIIKALVTVKADNKESIYLSDIVDLTWTTTLGEIYNNDNLEIELSCDVTNTSFVGNYDITFISYNNENYDISFVDGIYSIRALDLDIKIEDQIAYYTSKLVYPTYKGQLPGEPDNVCINYYYTDGTLFEGVISEGNYELYAEFSQDNENYNLPDKQYFTFTVEVRKFINLKEGSTISFITKHEEIKGRKTYIYRKSYYELGYTHGIDDVDFKQVILGNIEQNTSVNKLLMSLDVDLNKVVISNHKGVDIYKADSSSLSTLTRRYVATGWVIKLYSDDDFSYDNIDNFTASDIVYISVLGDVYSSGTFNIYDVSTLYDYIDNPYDVEDYLYLAMMIINKGSISIYDYSLLYSIVDENSSISDYFNKVESVESKIESINSIYTFENTYDEIEVVLESETDCIGLCSVVNIECDESEMIYGESKNNSDETIDSNDVIYYEDSNIKIENSLDEDENSSSKDNLYKKKTLVQYIRNKEDLVLNEEVNL